MPPPPGGSRYPARAGRSEPKRPHTCTREGRLDASRSCSLLGFGHQRLGVALGDPGDLERWPAERAGRRENVIVLRFHSHTFRIRLLQHLHPHGDLGREPDRHVAAGQRRPLCHPTTDPSRGAVPEQRRGHGFGAFLGRHDLHPEPGSSLLHLHRPRLHVQGPGGNECLPQRLHVLRAHVVYIGGQQRDAAGLRRLLGEEDPQRVGIVLRVPLPRTPPAFQHAPLPGRRTRSEDAHQAGAGTGSRPCAASTHPFPTATGQAYTASTSSCSNPSIAPTMSSTASTAPTSCRCTFSGATPCTRPSASPTSWNARTARSFTQSDTGARSTTRTSSPTWRPCARSGIVNSTCLHPTPHRTAFRTVTPTPSNPNRPGSASSQFCGTPRASSAPRVISPEMPAAGSRIAMRIGLKRWNINGLGPVEPPGAGIEDHYAIVRVKRPPRLELDGSRERSSAFRRGVDPLQRLQVTRRRVYVSVRDRHRSAAALAQCSKHQAIPEWGGNPQPRGNRLGVWPRRARLGPGLEPFPDGRASRGLHAV